ncbi:MAG: hypothetical protein LBN74_04140 [Prevotella sp.]|jgi:hypothetical protein|nr:hypothetical protein [Prevotella sp.]
MENIDKLLEKYFEGETTLKEESILRSYFRQTDIEERYKLYAPMFNFFAEERNGNENATEKKRKKIPLYVWAAIAASLLLVVCLKSFYHTSVIEGEKTLVYIDGKEITDSRTINLEALNSIQNISDIDEDIVSSQIGILDSFTE